MRYAVLLTLAACAVPPAPAMNAATPAAPPSGKAVVVFVRPASACDTSDHARVVDEHGAFAGALGPDTSFTLAVEPGAHHFFVWPGLDLTTPLVPQYAPVDAVRVDVEAGETTFVAVRPVKSRSLSCGRNAIYAFERPDAARADEWIARAKPLAPDREAGALLLARDPATTQYLALARRKASLPEVDR